MRTDNAAVKAIMDEINKVIIGKEDVVRKILICVLAKGHVLLEDVPGVGKTTIATAFSKAMSLNYNRLQFTPDVMPSDVTGFTIYNKATNSFEYREGVIMCNLFLADEINRTSSKTQAALLEAMEEGAVTVDGVTRKLDEPFMVIATQNPVGSIGTAMLPESQMDRFMFRLSVGYPGKGGEIEMLRNRLQGVYEQYIKAVADKHTLHSLYQQVEQVYVHDNVYEYIVDIVNATRNNEYIKLGVSPRGTIAISRAARAEAFIAGRDYVIPEDVRAVLLAAVNHRIVLSAKAKMEQVSVEDIVNHIIQNVEAKDV